MASYGTVVLNGIVFDLDPEDYTVLGGHRHGSIHHLVNGTEVFQDFGFSVTHARLSLAGTLTNFSTFTALANLYHSPSAIQMTYTDWMGNDLIVIFTPGEGSFTVKPIRGATSAWTYNLSLCIISATQWNGLLNPT